MTIMLIEWLKEHLLTCPSKHFFHIDCPGCGLQRSLVALLEGDVGESLRLYPATIPIIFMLCFTALHLKFDFRNGAAIIRWNFVLNVVIITVFYFYKIFTLKIFEHGTEF
jgi:hypothetical protein